MRVSTPLADIGLPKVAISGCHGAHACSTSSHDITLIVEVSTTLMPNDWTTLATSTLGAPFTGPGYWAGDSATPGARYVTIRDTVPIAPGLRRFVRLRVVH